jgi:hypothetical protein
MVNLHVKLTDIEKSPNIVNWYGKFTNLRKLSCHRDYRIIGVSQYRGFTVSCLILQYDRDPTPIDDLKAFNPIKWWNGA